MCHCIFFGINPRVSKHHALHLNHVTATTRCQYLGPGVVIPGPMLGVCIPNPSDIPMPGHTTSLDITPEGTWDQVCGPESTFRVPYKVMIRVQQLVLFVLASIG